jgi:mRNA interferase MazF
MPGFKRWDIIKVPFPYTDRPVRERRPALVVGLGSPADGHDLLWALMITSRENRPWYGDVSVTDLAKAGLPAPSVIRTAKIATIEGRDAEKIGKLETVARVAVEQYLRGIFGSVLTARK